MKVFARIAFLILLNLSIPLLFAFAAEKSLQSNYIPLQDVSLPNGKKLFSPSITTYLQNIYSFGIAIAGALAVIMIVLAGIRYMLSEAFTDKAAAKDQIKAALTGLLLALVSYVLLYTINPDLVKLNLNLVGSKSLQGKDATLTPGGVGGAGGGGGGDTSGNTRLLKQNADGSYSMDGGVLALDTDGTTDPGIDPTTHQPETSYKINGKSLDSTKDMYVVVPDDSPIPLGSNVLITNPSTGQQEWAIVGDHGGTRGYGEVSVAVSKKFGLYSGKDSIDGKLNFQYFPKK